MKINRRKLRRIIEAEIKLSADEVNAARRELEVQGGAADDEKIAQAIKDVATDDDKDKFSDDQYGEAYVKNDPDASRHPDGDIVDTGKLTNESLRLLFKRLIRESINEISYDGYEIDPNEDGSVSIAGKDYVLVHPIAGDVSVLDIRSEYDNSGKQLLYVKAKKPYTPDYLAVEKVLKDEQIQTVKNAVLANKNEFEVEGDEGIFKFRRV